MRRLGAPVVAVAGVLLAGWCGCALAPRGGDSLAEARGWFAAGEYSKVAERFAGDAIRKLPRSRRAEAYDLLGQSYNRSGRLNDALETLQLAEGLYPKDINILSDLAHILSRAGLHDRARPYYQRVLDIHPNNAAGNMGIAAIYRRQGMLAKSEYHYRKALDEEGWDRNPDLWRACAEVLAERQRFEEAAEAIHRALALKRDVRSLLSLARFHRKRGLMDDAYARIDEAAAAAPEEPGLLLQKALWLLEDGRDAEAEEIASSVLELEPADALARWTRASALLRSGKLVRARADLIAAAAAERRHPFVARAARAMLRELARAGR